MSNQKKLKILFIGDYSNLHTTLARELKRNGHEANVLSDKCGYMNLSTDFFLKRSPGIGGNFKYLFDLFNLLPKLKNYDVVQLINTNFLSLKPQKIKYFFDILKKQNKSVFLTLAGNDYNFVKACNDAKIFRFSEFKIGEEFSPGHLANPDHLYGWLSPANKHWSEYLLENISGAMAVLPEYHMPVKDILGERVAFTNLPIDFSELPPCHHRFLDNKVNIMVGMRSGFEDMKGTKILYNIAEEIEKDLKDKVKVDLVQDVAFSEFLKRVSKSDIILDQLYSYSPAMTALYGMSMGKVVATGAQQEYYNYIGNPEIKPIFSLSPFDKNIKERLINLIDDRNEILLRGEQGLDLVKRENDSRIVAEKFVNHWCNFLN